MNPIICADRMKKVHSDIRGPIFQEANRMSAEGISILKLNTGNPATFGFKMPDSVRQALVENADKAVAYCDLKGMPAAREAIWAYEQSKGITSFTPDDVYIGNGVSELAPMCLNTLLNPGDEILIPSPSYSLWTNAAYLAGATPVFYRCHQENNWQPDPDEIRAQITDRTRALLIINPNNPTGLAEPKETVAEMAKFCREMGIFLVVDECFGEFLDEPERYSILGEIDRFPNVFVLKAFTKLYAMAGVRLGYGFCSDGRVLEAMERVRQPWSVSALAQAGGEAALKETEYVEKTRRLIRAQREFLKNGLKELGFAVWDSMANYLFFSGDPGLKEKLLERKILIRSCANYPGLDGRYYRICVRTEAENRRFLEELKRVLEHR